jgi:hypothetical protein
VNGQAGEANDEVLKEWREALAEIEMAA